MKPCILSSLLLSVGVALFVASTTCQACRLAMYAGTKTLDPTLLLAASEHSLAHQAVRTPFVPGILDLGDGRNHPVNLDGWGFAVFPEMPKDCLAVPKRKCDQPSALVFKSGEPILVPHAETDDNDERLGGGTQPFLVPSSQVHASHADDLDVDSYLRLHPRLDQVSGDPAYESRLVLAHVRAQVGGSASDENAHPFHWKGLVFMHNGALSHHSERRPALLDSLRPEVRELIQGETDSELLFALITNALPREKLFGEASSERSAELISQAELVAAVEATIDHIDRSEVGACAANNGSVIHASSLNMVVANAESFVASRYRNCALQEPPSLYVAMGTGWDGKRMRGDVQRSGGAKNVQSTSDSDASSSSSSSSSLTTASIIIASEPLTRDDEGLADWTLVPKNQLLAGSLLAQGRGVNIQRTCIIKSCDEEVKDVFFVGGADHEFKHEQYHRDAAPHSYLNCVPMLSLGALGVTCTLAMCRVSARRRRALRPAARSPRTVAHSHQQAKIK